MLGSKRNILVLLAIIIAGLIVVSFFVITDENNNEQFPGYRTIDIYQRQIDTLKDEGFTDVKVLDDKPFLKCSNDDNVLTSINAEATNIAGKRVSLTVCCGYFKGCTIRH